MLLLTFEAPKRCDGARIILKALKQTVVVEAIVLTGPKEIRLSVLEFQSSPLTYHLPSNTFDFHLK